MTVVGSGDVGIGGQQLDGLGEILCDETGHVFAVVALSLKLTRGDVDRVGDDDGVAIDLQQFKVSVGTEEVSIADILCDFRRLAVVGCVLQQQVAAADVCVVVGVVAVARGYGIRTLAVFVGCGKRHQVGATVAVRAVVVGAEVAGPTIEVVGELLVLSGVGPHLVAA